MKIVEVKKIVGPSKVNEHFVEVKVKSDVQYCHQRLRSLWYWLNPNPTLNEPHNDIHEILMPMLDNHRIGCVILWTNEEYDQF